MQECKLVYNIRTNDKGSDNFGLIVQKTLSFETFSDAVIHSRIIANTNMNLVGKPTIVLTEK